MSYRFDKTNPTNSTEIRSRKVLRGLIDEISQRLEIEIEPFTAWENDTQNEDERVQGVFLNISSTTGPICVGAIVRRKDGELRQWPRDGLTGPISGSTIIHKNELGRTVLELIDSFNTA